MHIAILTNEYPPHIYGGAGVHVDNLSRELVRLAAEEDHHLTILCFGGQRESLPHLTVQGIAAPSPLPARDPRHQKLLDTLQRNLVMTGALGTADLIHCHTWYTHLAGCLLKQLLGAPLVLTTHSLEPQRPWKEEQLGRGYRISTWVERTAYRNADGVIAVSRAMGQDVQEIYGVSREKIRVIYNGVDTGAYRPIPDPTVPAYYGLDMERPFVLFVGRITHQKGLFHLLEAVPYLAPHVQVVLCAADPDTPEIGEALASRVAALEAAGRRVVWISRFLPQPELVRLYSQAAVFVCPSIYEPFGIINLEAMACGTPVVGAAVGGIREVVRHEETGLLVPFEPQSATNPEPRDPRKYALDLAAAINRLLVGPELRKEMGRRARQVVEEHFSWPSVARQTLKYYQELLAAAKGQKPS
ncbi:MAG: glycogen synthase [Desulfobaccales bacterium]